MKLSVVAALLFVCGAIVFGRGALIPFKAFAAQQLLDVAWQRARSADGPQRPWPWADTWPVARLRVDRLGVSQVVLAGVNGAALAFAPGQMRVSIAPGESGNVVIAGHRDTHFSYLRFLRPGDRIELERRTGESTAYTVHSTGVVDESNMDIMAATGHATLTLITCYPFDAVSSGGPLRYVVQAGQSGTVSSF